MTDIMLDGGGYHQGYLNYNGAKETPELVARRLSQQQLGLTGRFQLEKELRSSPPSSGGSCKTTTSEIGKDQTLLPKANVFSSASQDLLRPKTVGSVKDSFQSVFRDRDRRHMEWNLKAEYRKSGKGELKRTLGFEKSGPAHPFSALWDGPATNWARLTRGNTLPTFRPMSVPGI